MLEYGYQQFLNLSGLLQSAANVENLCFRLMGLRQIWRCSTKVSSNESCSGKWCEGRMPYVCEGLCSSVFFKMPPCPTSTSYVIWAWQVGCGTGYIFTRWLSTACTWGTAPVVAKHCSGRGREGGGEEEVARDPLQVLWVIDDGRWERLCIVRVLLPSSLFSVILLHYYLKVIQIW